MLYMFTFCFEFHSKEENTLVSSPRLHKISFALNVTNVSFKCFHPSVYRC